jgi:DNA-binding GntR family transcriptional regulator
MDYFEYLRSIRSSNLSSSARIVALIIASYNPSFPTNKLIAEGCGLSERTVRNAKRELVAAGYLRQKRTYNAANNYQVVAPNNHLNTNINTKEIQTNKSSNEDLYSSSNKKKPREIIEIKEMTAASPWDGWK